MKKLKEAELVDQQMTAAPAIETEVPAVEPTSVEEAPVVEVPVEEEDDKTLVAAEIEVKEDKVEIEIPKDALEDVAKVIANKEAQEEVLSTEDAEVADAEANALEDQVVQSAEPVVQESCKKMTEAEECFGIYCMSDDPVLTGWVGDDVNTDDPDEGTLTFKSFEDAQACLKDLMSDPCVEEYMKEGALYGVKKLPCVITEADENSECEGAVETVIEDEKNITAAGTPDVEKIEPAPIDDELKEACCPTCGKNPCECEVVEEKCLKEAEEIDSVEDDLGGIEEPVENMDFDPSILDNLDDGEGAPVDFFADAEDIDLDSLLGNIESDAEDTLEAAEAEVLETADKMQKSVDFLKSLVEDNVEEGFDINSLDMDLVDDEEIDDAEEDFVECIERIPVDLPKKPFEKEEKEEPEELKPIHESEIYYPAGSKPSNEEDLVRAYEKTASAKREALAKFREAMRTQKVEQSEVDPRFKEAIKGVVKSTEPYTGEKQSWSENKFIDRYQERLSWKEMLSNGLLG